MPAPCKGLDIVKIVPSVRSSKGFLFQSEDTSRPVLCRDVRGFPAAVEASRDRSKLHPGRLVIVVPDLAMEDWLTRWADDAAHPRRSITITRRTDGTQLRFAGTILSYGYGIDTSIQIERLDHEGRSSRGARPAPASDVDVPPKSAVQETVGARRAAPVRRRAAR